ncbi:zwei Ig domain protein zig-4-like [Stegodyphus dumicola]|uniref:zwei Ig domain protein zig-4-like n=1 Tax=Stegodyphus dumicola TaxID=202533 RepID=UPI0015B11BA5|nr:zwei Ig domain protein zig-4-like [Stegodyphus dumicola]XP_035207765.1 zwei Ig domain protein zig-4-like [Stegodyphus dumicola]XP_035207766.1 zwei Ig domain protein zig-4-like [Stegodyphus dumicola]
MLHYAIAIFMSFALIPLVLSRHIDLDTRGRHEDARGENNHSWQVTRTHLRLHAKPPRVLRVKEGENQFLECQAGGNPSPVIHWLKNGVKLSQNGRDGDEESTVVSDDFLQIENRAPKTNIGSTTSRLYLDCISAKDEAEYTCVAENPYHRTSTTTQVYVAPSSEDTACPENIFGTAPRIYAWTKTMIENQGQETKLTCRASGHPRPTIEWFDSREEELGVTGTSKYEILPNGDLVIRDLTWSDMGNYICIASNVHGTAKEEIFLYPAAIEA